MNTAIITGANRGIGLATAQCLAAAGHRVVLVCRDADRGAKALASLAPLPGGERHHMVVADLASLESVRGGARRILELDHALAALVNNAAALPARRTLSSDGFELQLAVTHLGHFVLTRKLSPLLERHPGTSRVVTVSSAAHHGSGFDFDDPNWERKRYRKLGAYQQSKLANVLFTKALARRLEGTRVEAVAHHPGVYDTGILRDYLRSVPGGALAGGLIAKHPRKAGPTLADVAVGRRDENLAGAYLDKGVRAEPAAAALDVEAQERLWEWSRAAVGE